MILWNFEKATCIQCGTLQSIARFKTSHCLQHRFLHKRGNVLVVGVLADRQAKQFLIAVDSSPKRLRYGYNPLASLATSQDLHNYSLMSRAFNTFHIQRFKQVLW